MTRVLSIITGTALILLPLHGAAQDNVTPACLSQIYAQMALEERIYRSVIFGQESTAEAEEGSVLLDIDAQPWIKTGEDEWKSFVKEGEEETVLSDAWMDERSGVPERRGLLEIRTTPTSDLIPAMVQSMRAFSCRLRAICSVALESLSAKEGQDTVTVRPEGCITFEDEPIMDACTQVGLADTEPGNCMNAVNAILEREEKMLQLIVSYDAAYRTLLQFSGIFDDFLVDFRFSLLHPLWQMVRTLGALDGLPCFQGQCEE